MSYFSGSYFSGSYFSGSYFSGGGDAVSTPVDPPTTEAVINFDRTRDVDLGQLSAGMRIELTFKKNGSAWNEIDSIAIRLEKPDRETTLSGSMTLDSDNVWYYDLTGTDIPDEEESDGYWTVEIEITDGAVVVEYPREIGFSVKRQP